MSLRGAAVGAWVSLAIAAGMQARNPWFLDSYSIYLFCVSLPLALLGGLLGRLPRRAAAPPGRAAPLLLLAALGLVPALSLGWPRPEPSGRVRLLVFGMDGATYDLLDPLAAELPTITALRARGAEATLRSMEPLFSPLLWTSMATGRPPEEHGVHGFRVHATDCRVARFWDVMEAAGIRVGTWKWLVTWPPTRLSAFQVPAWLAPSPETWPPELSFVKEIELSRRMARKQVAARRSLLALAWEGSGRGLRLSTLADAARLAALQRLGPDPQRDFLEGQLLRVRMDRDAFLWALHRTDPEVVTFTDYATDAVPHRFWRYHEPERFPGTDPALVARWGEAVRDTYRQSDAVLAELIAAVGPEARVVLLSDHGHHGLADGGQGHLLAPRTERLLERVQAEVGPADLSRLGHKLVLALLGPDPVAERAALLAWLDGLRVERTGQPLFRVEEVPGSPHSVGLAVVEEGLALASLETDRVGGEPLRLYLSAGEGFSGDHHDRGVWISAGPGLAKGRKMPEMHLLDVAPTLLALVGLPASHEQRGRVPAELWEGAPPALPEGPHSYDDLVEKRVFEGGEASAEVNEEQLRALGYIE